MNGRRTLVLIGLVLGLSRCSTGLDWSQDEETILFQIEGTVTSSSDGSPVPGARVVLGRGGYFSIPSPVREVQTDGSGHYKLEESETVLRDNCGGSQVWLTAHAEGFRWTYAGGLDCTNTLQTIPIVLDVCELPPAESEPCNSEPFLETS